MNKDEYRILVDGVLYEVAITLAEARFVAEDVLANFSPDAKITIHRWVFSNEETLH